MAGVSKCMKYSMFIFNFFFWVCGSIILGVSIWTRVSTTQQNVGIDSSTLAGINLLIAVGALIMVLGFLGCCGAIKESRCMLMLFFIGLLLIVILQLAVGITGAVNKSQIEAVFNLTLSINVDALQSTTGIYKDYQEEFQKFEKEISEFYVPEFYISSLACQDVKCRCNWSWKLTFCKYSLQKEDLILKKYYTQYSSSVLALIITSFMNKCCGLVNGPEDWGKNFKNPSLKICQCELETSSDLCTKYQDRYIYKKPCGEVMMKIIKDNLVIIIAVAFGLAVIEILGLVFSMSLYCQIGRK